jgi:hypothetical protein
MPVQTRSQSKALLAKSGKRAPVKKAPVKKAPVKKAPIKKALILSNKIVNYVEYCSDYNSEEEELLETRSYDSNTTGPSILPNSATNSDMDSDFDEEDAPIAELYTLKQLGKMGLNSKSHIVKEFPKFNLTEYYYIVISALELDLPMVSVNSTNVKNIKNKYAVAPEGYYWKYCKKYDFSNKDDYLIDWYELAHIPKNRKLL